MKPIASPQLHHPEQTPVQSALHVEGMRHLRKGSLVREQPEPLDGRDQASLRCERPKGPDRRKRGAQARLRLHALPQGWQGHEGGLSGAPLLEKSTALLREIVAKSAIPVVASGGIFDAESAQEKFQAGAQLIQLYTGFVYRGPRLLREIMEAM